MILSSRSVLIKCFSTSAFTRRGSRIGFFSPRVLNAASTDNDNNSRHTFSISVCMPSLSRFDSFPLIEYRSLCSILTQWIIGKVSLGGGRNSVDFYVLISIKNILAAWRIFSHGKKKKSDVAEFELRLEDNIFSLHTELSRGTWRPGPYTEFYIQDPKVRKIHKAAVRDRVLYQAIYQVLYKIFDPSFMYDSYSSRNQKGTHRAVKRFDQFARKVTGNYRNRGYVLKCDIRKFFDSIDHSILFQKIQEKIDDEKLLFLISKILKSFERLPGKGLPLGNVTSQLFANIYLNELDQFVKRQFKVAYYIRYCDDFVFLSDSEEYLEQILLLVNNFLKARLLLELHPRKVIFRKIIQGTDFLGYVSLPYYAVLRTKTKRRMFRKIRLAAKRLEKKEISENYFKQVTASYQGMLTHCNGWKLGNQIEQIVKSV